MTDADRAYEAAEEAIAKALAEGSIELDLSGEEFNSLKTLPESIGKLSTLTDLYLNNTQISDASPLAGLSALTALNLSNTQISDATPLAALSALTVLSLSNTQISDATPLAELSALTMLYLNNTKISDATPLAALSALTILHLSNTHISDAAPLAKLSALMILYLSNTEISDATPLAGLSALTLLNLGNTEISDLRPIRSLRRLARVTKGIGLNFLGSAAARLDPRIAEISAIEDNKTRAQTLFDYLEKWEPPAVSGDTAPPPDEIFPVEVEDDRLEVAASSPTQAERDEALKQSMHEALKDLAERLSQAAGNHFPDLAKTARRLETLLDCPFDELDMPRTYVGLRPLLIAFEAGSEDDQPFTSKVTALLDQVEFSGLGLTRDNPDVELLIKRAGRQKDHPDSEEDLKAQTAMSEVVASNVEAIGDQLRNLQTQLAERDDPEAVESKKAVNRNILWRIGVAAGPIGGAVVGSAATDIAQIVLAPAIFEFVAMHSGTLTNAAMIHGREFADWFGKALKKLLSNH